MSEPKHEDIEVIRRAVVCGGHSYPRTGCFRCEASAALDALVRERDEARAEVARWKKSFAGHVYVSNEKYADMVGDRRAVAERVRAACADKVKCAEAQKVLFLNLEPLLEEKDE